MQKSKKVSLWTAVLVIIGIGAANVQAATHAVTASQAGTWDTTGHHTTGRYFVGHSIEIPPDTISYFLFNLDPVKGKHVNDAFINVPGTNEFAFTANWTGHPAGQTQFQMKTKETALAANRFTVGDILNGMPNPKDNWMIYHYQMSEENLSYAWFPDGHTHDFEIVPFHGTRFPGTLAKVQAAVNTGGNYLIFLCSGFGQTLRTEEYEYNGVGVAFNRPVVLTFFTTN